MEETPLQKRARLEMEIGNDTYALDKKKGKLAQIERECSHNWGPTEADHIYHEGYHDPGDPPGTMGVDRRLPMDVPAKTIKQWKRVCLKCGKTSRTKRTKENVTEVPEW